MQSFLSLINNTSLKTSLGSLRKRLGRLLLFLLPPIILAASGAAVYYAVLDYGFYLDDSYTVQENSKIRMVTLSAKNIKTALNAHPLKYEFKKPISYLSLAFNFYFGQFNPRGYHLVNVGLHIAVAILLFFWLRQLLAQAVYVRQHPSAYTRLSLALSLLWLLHPAHTDCVSYVSQRDIIWGAFFFLLAHYWYLRARSADGFKIRMTFFLGCAGAVLGAVYSRQNAIMLVPILWLTEKLLIAPGGKKTGRLLLGMLLAGTMLAALPYSGDIYHRLSSGGEGEVPSQHSSLLLDGGRIGFFFLTKALYPALSGLSLEYGFTWARNLFHPPQAFGAWILVLIFLFFLLQGFRRRPLFTWGVCWFILLLLPEAASGAANLFFLKRLYLPTIGLLPLLALIYLRAEKAGYRIPAAVLLLLLIPTLGILTAFRTHVWVNSISLYRDAAAKTPYRARPWVNLAKAYMDADEIFYAQECLDRAFKLDPFYAPAQEVRAALYMKKKSAGNAVAIYRILHETHPDNPDYSYRLGLFYIKNNAPLQAAEHFSSELKLHPQDSRFWEGLGVAESALGKYPQAKEDLEQSLRLDPANINALSQLGLLAVYRKDYETARRHFQRILDLSPKQVTAMHNLGAVALQEGKFEEAIGIFKRALALEPNNVPIKVNLGSAYAQAGDRVNAVKIYVQVIKSDPQMVEPYINMAMIMFELKKFSMAEELWLQAQNLTPQDPQIDIGLAKLYADQGKAAAAEERLNLAGKKASQQGNKVLVDKILKMKVNLEWNLIKAKRTPVTNNPGPHSQP